MKFTNFIYSLLLLSCTMLTEQTNGPVNVAYDEMADGKIRASATRALENQDVCFDITLIMEDVNEKEAMASNWTIAWVDTNSRYHLLSTNQRDPASAPRGSRERWTNHFRTCTPKDRQNEVNHLILTPKELSYRETEGMKLEWK